MAGAGNLRTCVCCLSKLCGGFTRYHITHILHQVIRYPMRRGAGFHRRAVAGIPPVLSGQGQGSFPVAGTIHGVAPKCKSRNEANSSRCSQCGELFRIMCPKCGKFIQASSSKCHCGTRFDAARKVYESLEKCGNSLRGSSKELDTAQKEIQGILRSFPDYVPARKLLDELGKAKQSNCWIRWNLRPSRVCGHQEKRWKSSGSRLAIKEMNLTACRMPTVLRSITCCVANAMGFPLVRMMGKRLAAARPPLVRTSWQNLAWNMAMPFLP